MTAIHYFRRALIGTTALVGVFLAHAAHAATTTISSSTTSAVHLNTGDSLVVTSGGSITVLGEGDVIVQPSAAAGTITNAGHLSSDNSAIALATSSSLTGALVNQAGGVISGGTGNANNAAISVFRSADIVGGVDNDGIMKGSSGFILLQSDISGGILNGVHAAISGIKGTGIYLQTTTMSGGIDNSGVIAGSTLTLGNAGIHLSRADLSGELTNRSGARIKGLTGVRIGTLSDVSGGVNNAGTITGKQVGIDVFSRSDLSGGVINSGLISGVTGIRVSSHSNLSGGITNSGTIKGKSGTAIYMNGLSAPVDIDITGGHIIGDVIDTNPANGDSPVKIDGNFTTQGNFDVSSIEITSGHTLTVGSGKTITEKTLTFDVDNATTVGKLVVAGGAINLSGVTLAISATAGVSLSVGDEIKIGDGTRAIIGGPGGIKTGVADNTALFDFQIADGTAATTPTNSSDLFLFVVAEGAGPTPSPTPAPTPSPSPSPTVDGVGWQSAREVVDILSDILSDRLDGPDDASENQRLAFAGNSGASAGNDNGGRAGWGQLFGLASDEGARDGLAGYLANTYGFAMGAETPKLITPGVVGAAISYAATDADARDTNTTSTNVDSYELAVYARREFGVSYLRGLISYAWNDNETDRHNVGGPGGPTAHADFGASQEALRLDAGRHLARGNAVITPGALLNWLHYDPCGYTETGAGLSNMTVHQRDMNLFEIGGGIKVEWGWKDRDGNRFLPEIRAGYRHDFIGDRIEDTAAFIGGGATFSSQGIAPARDRFNLGAGFTYRSTANWDIRAQYNYDFRQDYHAHAGLMRAVYKF